MIVTKKKNFEVIPLSICQMSAFLISNIIAGCFSIQLPRRRNAKLVHLAVVRYLQPSVPMSLEPKMIISLPSSSIVTLTLVASYLQPYSPISLLPEWTQYCLNLSFDRFLQLLRIWSQVAFPPFSIISQNIGNDIFYHLRLADLSLL